MLKRLQFKMIGVVLGTLLVVFSAVLLVLNLSVYQTSVKRTEDFVVSVVENDGFLFPQKGAREGGRNRFANPQTAKTGRYFYAKVEPSGPIFELNLEMMFDFSKEDAKDFVVSALKTGKAKGDLGSCSFWVAEKPYGQMVVFAERSIEIDLLEQLTNTSLWAAGIVSFVLACLATFFAKWMIIPVKTAFEKQRRFISDASHELKTPLTIIDMNVEVLQNEMGENQRLGTIKAQSMRMNGLVQDLFMLAKAGESQEGIVLHTFSLSGAVLHTALEFESLAFEEGKQYSCDVAEHVAHVGDEKQIKQLVGILIDNAIKYTGPNGEVKVTLHMEGKHPRISVFNTGMGVSAGEREKIFERFYRSDESRSRETGGYGIGLSIAKAIVESHKGKITVAGEYGKWIRFDVTL